jgi:hypothetical protein
MKLPLIEKDVNGKKRKLNLNVKTMIDRSKETGDALKKESILDFTAKDARCLYTSYADKKDKKDLIDILTIVKNVAKDKNSISIEDVISDRVIAILREKGFKVTSADSMAAQKEGIYYYVTW